MAKVQPVQRRLQIEKFVFEELPKLDGIEFAGNVERMKGKKNYYKIRFGDFLRVL